MKKALKVLVCLAGTGAAGAYICKDKIKDKYFNAMYEDKLLKAQEVARLLGDFIQWPIHFVRAMLP